MFTGIVQAVGEVVSRQALGGDLHLCIEAGKLDLTAIRPGDSLCTNGVCLTVTESGGGNFHCDVSRETLALSTLGELVAGSPVNLEPPLTPLSALGGHLVSGHVDGVGTVVSYREDGRCSRWLMRAPEPLARYLAHKGSVCVDGVSLTINAVNGSEFELNIIPQTMAETIFHSYRVDSRFNLEVDQVARYLERLLLGGAAANPDAPESCIESPARGK